MATKDRIPLRDHFLQITPGFAQDAIDRMTMLLRGAGIEPVANQRLSAIEVGRVLQPLVQQLLDLETEDPEIGSLLSGLMRKSAGTRGLHEATLNLAWQPWGYRNFDEAFQKEHAEEARELINGLYVAAHERLNRLTVSEVRDRSIVAELASGIDLAIYPDYYMPIAANGALSKMSLFQPRGYSEVNFDALYPLILGLLDALLKLQAQPFVVLDVA